MWPLVLSETTIYMYEEAFKVMPIPDDTEEKRKRGFLTVLDMNYRENKSNLIGSIKYHGRGPTKRKRKAVKAKAKKRKTEKNMGKVLYQLHC